MTAPGQANDADAGRVEPVDARLWRDIVMDLHKALGVSWGDNIYLVIERLRAVHHPAREAADGWMPIESAQEDPDIWIWVFAPGSEFDLPDIICPCRWHPDGGFCVDELRYPTLWHRMPVPAPPPPSAEQGESL